jgi:hypothetical protein
MKNTRAVAAALCLTAGGMLCTASALAGNDNGYVGSLPQEKINVIEENIVTALQSGVPGMQADAAQLVRDMISARPDQSFSSCVIPLMALLKDEQADCSARILAALALDQLDTPMGHYAIERTVSFTSDTKLKYVCEWLAYERKTGSHPEDKGIASFEPLPEGDE